MLIFLDFETCGLNGEVIEACAFNERREIINHVKINIDSLDFNDESTRKYLNLNFEKFMDGLINLGEDNVIVFWHHYMITYLCFKYPEIFRNLKGKFLTFIDFYSIFDGVQKSRYSIDYITEKLTGRNHRGNAKDDAWDLMECYEKIKSILSNCDISLK